MPEIAVEQSTFERLQQHARPLVDTSDSVIVRALDALDQLGSPQERSMEAMTFGPSGPVPDVKHTRMLAASIDGRSVRSNWNNVLRTCSYGRRNTMATSSSSDGGAP